MARTQTFARPRNERPHPALLSLHHQQAPAFMFFPNRLSFFRPPPLLTLPPPSLATAASAASTAASGPGAAAAGTAPLAEVALPAAATSSSDTATAATLPATAGSTVLTLLATALSVTVVARLEALLRLPTAAAPAACAAAREVDRERLPRLLPLRLRVRDRLLNRPRSARSLLRNTGSTDGKGWAPLMPAC